MRERVCVELTENYQTGNALWPRFPVACWLAGAGVGPLRHAAPEAGYRARMERPLGDGTRHRSRLLSPQQSRLVPRPLDDGVGGHVHERADAGRE
jgi:hypothetical protein